MGKHRVGFKGKQNLLLWDEYADVGHAMDYFHISLSGANTFVTEWHLSIMNILSSQAQQLSGGRTDFSSQPGLQSILQKSSRDSASHAANSQGQRGTNGPMLPTCLFLCSVLHLHSSGPSEMILPILGWVFASQLTDYKILLRHAQSQSDLSNSSLRALLSRRL